MTKGQKKPKTGSVKVRRLKVPLEDLRSMTDEDRFSYYLLGHMFNELMCLQKMIHFAMPRHGDRRSVRFHPEMAQAQFMFRIALGKVSEVRDELEGNKHLQATWDRLIKPKWPEEQHLRAALFEALDAAHWLKKLRNKLGFHFPRFNQWAPFIRPTDEWKDDEIFLSERSGNIFYDAANDVALHWMLSLPSSDPEAEGPINPIGTEGLLETVDPMIEKMIELITLMNNYIEGALNALVRSVLNEDVSISPGEPVVAPHFADVKIPFWTHMPSRPTSD